MILHGAASVALGAALCFALLADCAAPPSAFGRRDPANRRAHVPAVAAPSVTFGLVSQTPVEPKGWMEQNKAVGPAGAKP